MMAVFIFRYGFSLLARLTVLEGLRTGAETPCFLMKQRHEIKENSVFIVPWIHWAVLGPSLALLYLYFYPENYTTLFYIAFMDFCYSRYPFVKEKKERFKRKELPYSRFGLLKVSPPCTKVVIGL
jgi:hypothetical protein